MSDEAHRAGTLGLELDRQDVGKSRGWVCLRDQGGKGILTGREEQEPVYMSNCGFGQLNAIALCLSFLICREKPIAWAS